MKCGNALHSRDKLKTSQVRGSPFNLLLDLAYDLEGLTAAARQLEIRRRFVTPVILHFICENTLKGMEMVSSTLNNISTSISFDTT